MGKDIFIKAPHGIALISPLVVGAVVIGILALVGMNSESTIAIWPMLVVALGMAWLVRMKIVLAIGQTSVVARAPLWRREIPFEDIVAVEVHPDDGTNSGLINWPVTTDKAKNLTRLNLGGSAKVVIAVSDSARGTGLKETPASERRDLEFVTSNSDAAQEIAQLVRTKQAAYLQ